MNIQRASLFAVAILTCMPALVSAEEAGPAATADAGTVVTEPADDSTAGALAQPAGAVAVEPVPAAKEKQLIGLAFDVGFASAYNFRGLNVFGDTQSQQKFAFHPSVTYTIPNVGLSFGYWGAFQINGDNKAAKVAVGAGHEQNFIVGYTHGWLGDALKLSAGFTVYFFPFADRATVGTTCPVYLEPSLTLSYSNVFDMSLQVAYFAGIQDAVAASRYLYIHPYVSKTFQMHKVVSGLIGVGYGYKLFNDFNVITDNAHYFHFDLELNIVATDRFYIKPGFRGAWTNLSGKDAGEEYMLLGTLNIGYSL